MVKTTFRKVVLAVLLVAALVAAQYYCSGVVSYCSLSRIEGWLEAAGVLAPVLYMLVMASVIVISPLPSMPLSIVAGAFFGPLLGTLYSALGALLGAVASFMIARLLGREIVERLLGKHLDLIRVGTKGVLTKVVFISRLIPFISFDIVSYGAGLTEMSLWRFTLATFLGMLPLTFLYNYYGSVIVVGGWLTTLVGLVMVALFFLVPYWAGKRATRQGVLKKAPEVPEKAPKDA